MRKLFALVMAAAMTFQLVMPAWADVGQDQPQETEETVLETGEEEAPAETEEPDGEQSGAETTEETEGVAPTEEVPAEELPADGEESLLEETEELEAGVTASGSFENIRWMLDENGVLTLSGHGEMEKRWYYGDYPWYKYKDQISSVIVEEG